MNLSNNTEFKAWPKIPRGQHESIVITEKMDGTNACIVIEGGEIIGIQSRKKLIKPTLLSQDKNSDNMGFAAWVLENEEELKGLGDGYHYGEWCGPSIQKNPHALEQREFFLFNTFRWNSENTPPSCCSVVPVLYSGLLTGNIIADTLGSLWETSAPNEEVKPEGVIVYFTKTRRYEKHTFRDQEGKWKSD